MSTVAVTLEERFERTRDGRVWTLEPCGPTFWARYLAVFDRVRVIARVQDVPKPRTRSIQASSEGVEFTALPSYRGLAQYVRRRVQARGIALGAIADADAVILTVPSPIASLVAPSLQSRGVPYAVEVVGDPHDAFSPGAVRHPLRPLMRWKMTRDMRRQIRGAVGAAYVTERALQGRYPCPALQVGVSDVLLSEEFVAHRPTASRGGSTGLGDAGPPVPRAFDERWPRPIGLISVGTFDQLYKAPDVLVDAVGLCVKQGVDLTLQFIGGGIYLEEIRRRAQRLRIADRVRFEGHVSSRVDLVAHLDASDLFVLPSRQEGLPRAMIEAMARGLPCIGSQVGGIPELLVPEDMVPARDARALAAKIEEVVRTPARMVAMSRRSLERARDFVGEGVAHTRTDFYRHVLRASARCVVAS